MPDPTDIARLRSSCDELLDQLQYTADEVQALRSVITRVPEEVLVLESDGQLSIKTILGHITDRDREMAAILSGDRRPADSAGEGALSIDSSNESPNPSPNPSPSGNVEIDWNRVATDDLLSQLQHFRIAFVDDLRAIAGRADLQVLEQLDPKLKQIVGQDVDAFREVAMRLHSAGIGAR